MALVFIFLSLLYTTVLCGPTYTPFEVYGPPPEASLLPVFRESAPAPVSQPSHHPDINTPDHEESPTVSPALDTNFPPSQPLEDTPTPSAGEVIPQDYNDVPVVPEQQHPPNTPETAEVPVGPAANGPDHSTLPEVISLQDKHGQYSFGVNQSGPEGQVVKEQGRLITTNEGWEYVIAKKGSFSYTSPEGIPVNVEWEADHNGFRIIKSSV